jgi:hypothetical protein
MSTPKNSIASHTQAIESLQQVIQWLEENTPEPVDPKALEEGSKWFTWGKPHTNTPPAEIAPSK